MPRISERRLFAPNESHCHAAKESRVSSSKHFQRRMSWAGFTTRPPHSTSVSSNGSKLTNPVRAWEWQLRMQSHTQQEANQKIESMFEAQQEAAWDWQKETNFSHDALRLLGSAWCVWIKSRARCWDPTWQQQSSRFRQSNKWWSGQTDGLMWLCILHWDAVCPSQAQMTSKAIKSLTCLCCVNYPAWRWKCQVCQVILRSLQFKQR